MTATRGEPRPLSIRNARRLALTAQRLAGPAPSVREPILDTVRAIGSALADLAAFAGADSVEVVGPVPGGWPEVAG